MLPVRPGRCYIAQQCASGLGIIMVQGEHMEDLDSSCSESVECLLLLEAG